jgi:predicted ATPase/DNA-binding SARP family transcriptional activator
MEFRILGPLEVLDEGRRLALGGRKPRALLALLLLHRGETLGLERLIDELWGERPPATAAKSLRVHVSRLRGALSAGSGERSDELVVTRGHGYQLMLDPERLDAHRFERLVAEGRRELAVGRPERALVALEEGLSLWRGRPLDDLAYEPFAQQAIARLDDMRVAATEELVEARLALGRHADVLSELDPLIAEQPYRERLRAQLMLALYRCDRQADALQAYQDARRALVEGLGIEPGERLRELERAILAQDPALAAPAARPDIEARSSEMGEAPAPPPVLGELPTGVITFLLTDIEGSSGLWEADAGAMAASLELHDELIADAVGRRAGRLLKSKGEGDSTLTVFRRASDAAACAVEIQRALQNAQWPGGLDLRARVALHTGEAHERGGDYFGPALNRAARLRGLARGGATVVSQATAEIVRERLPPETELVERGRQQLLGLSRPENVFELRASAQTTVADEPAPEAPRTMVAAAPDALGGPPAPPTAHLQAPMTRTIGREVERLAIAQLLSRGEIRLVTLTGPGGVGKTRLASEVGTVIGARWRDAWRFVSLASLQAPEQVETTLASSFEVIVGEGEAPREALARWLAPRELLLVIDNFEHVLAAAPLVSELLDAAPGVTVLATSREALGLRGERVAPVAGLNAEDAAQLFLERACDHVPDLELDDSGREAIVAMCRHLDGLPLAIELTAPWVALLPLSQLASRLQDPLAFLDRGARDAPARQRTLRATIDWSYNLLDDPARSAFAALAVFRGGCTIDAAQDIARASLDALAELRDKSLIARRDARLVMLETVRDYAAERLAERGDAEEIRSRHSRYFLKLAEDGEARLDGPDWIAWRRRLDAEVENFRAAFAWLVAARRVESALALASALQPFWRPGGHDREIRAWLNTALSLVDDTTSTEARARALLASSRGALLASLRSALLDPEQAERDAAAALELYRQLGDQAGVAESLVSLGYRQVHLARYRQAGALAEEALTAARAARDERAIGSALWLRATAGEGFDEVRSLAHQAVAHFHQSGAIRRIYPLLNSAAFAAIEYERYSEALPLLDEALPAARAADDGPGIAMIRGNEAIAHLMIGNCEEAADALSEQLRLCRDLSLDQTVEEALLCTAVIAASRGERHPAGLLAGAAGTRFEKRRRMAAEELVFRRIEDRLFRDLPETDPQSWDSAAGAGDALGDRDAIELALRALKDRPSKPQATQRTKSGPTDTRQSSDDRGDPPR